MMHLHILSYSTLIELTFSISCCSINASFANVKENVQRFENPYLISWFYGVELSPKSIIVLWPILDMLLGHPYFWCTRPNRPVWEGLFFLEKSPSSHIALIGKSYLASQFCKIELYPKSKNMRVNFKLCLGRTEKYLFAESYLF